MAYDDFTLGGRRTQHYLLMGFASIEMRGPSPDRIYLDYDVDRPRTQSIRGDFCVTVRCDALRSLRSPEINLTFMPI